MEKLEKIKKLTEEIIRKTSFVVDDIFFTQAEENVVWCNIRTKESGFFIGKNGENLRALNHVVKKIVEKSLFPTRSDDEPEEDKHKTGINIMLDVNDYQKRKIENLKNVAHMMAERARFFKSSIDVDPMSSYERRIIHEFLADTPDLKTESVGEGENRHIVIRYVPKVSDDLKV